MHRGQSAGVQVALHAGIVARQSRRAVPGRDGARRILDFGLVQALQPAQQSGPRSGIRHHRQVALLVAHSRAGVVHVARTDEAVVEAQRVALRRAVRQAHRVLHALQRPVAVGRLGAVAALTAVEPLFGRSVGDDLGRLCPHLRGEPARLEDAFFALVGGQIAAARTDDFARLPAAGQEVRRGLRTDRLAVRVEGVSGASHGTPPSFRGPT